jgi:putative cell wall-binding protein
MQSTTSWLRLVVVSGASLSLLLIGVTAAQALPTAGTTDAQTLNVTTSDIHHADDESPGHGWYRLIYNQQGFDSVARVVVDNSEPVHHDGALRLSTPDADGRLDIRYALDTRADDALTLADLAGAQVLVKVTSAPAPVFTVEYNCDGHSDAYPVGDQVAAYAGPMPSDGQWHTIDLGDDGPVWLTGGQLQSGAQLMSACPQNVLSNYGFLQSGAGADALVDDVSVGGLTTNFRVPPLERLAGENRSDTACRLAGHYFAGLNDVPPDAPSNYPNPSRIQHVAEAVVLVNDSRYADALAAGPLAALVDGPLLLNHGSTLDTDCDTWTVRQGDTAYLVGGKGVLSTQLEATLKERGMDVVRLGGGDRYETAVKVAQKIDALRPAGTTQQVFLASGTDFPDALSAGAPAGHSSGAVLLTYGSRMAPATAAYLAGRPDASVYAVGGDAAEAVTLPAGNEVVGADRYETATLVADRFFADPTTAAFASGAGFADALSAAAYGGNVGAPVLLVAPAAVPDSVASYAGRHRATLGGSVLLGGTGAVSATTFSSLSSALAPPR